MNPLPTTTVGEEVNPTMFFTYLQLFLDSIQSLIQFGS